MPSRTARVHAGQPGPALRRQLEGGVLHADRLKQMLREIVAERLTADPFDRLADPIDIDPVIPFFARIEDEWERQRCVLA